MIIVNESDAIDAFLESFHALAAKGAKRFLLQGRDQAVAFSSQLGDVPYSQVVVGLTSFDESYVAGRAGIVAAEQAYQEDWDAILVFDCEDVQEVFKRIERKAMLPSIVYSGKRAVRPVLISLAKSGTHLVCGLLIELGYDVVGPGGRWATPKEVPVVLRYAKRLGTNVPRWAGYDQMSMSVVSYAITSMLYKKLLRRKEPVSAFFSSDLKRLAENFCICMHGMPLDKVDGPFFINWSNTNEPKIIFNYRDPRAIIASYTRFLVKGYDGLAQAPDQYAHAAILRTMDNHHDRLMHTICDTTFPYWNALRESTWMFLHPQILNLSYEELVGLLGGGEERRQLLAVMRLMLHLNVGGDPDAVAKKAYAREAWTFSKGRIDTWRDEFSAEHLKAFNDRFGDIMAVYGYE